MVSGEQVNFIAALNSGLLMISFAYCKVFTLISHYCFNLEYLAGKQINKMDSGLGKCKTQIIVLATMHFKYLSLACIEWVKWHHIIFYCRLHSGMRHHIEKFCSEMLHVPDLITYGLNYFHSLIPGWLNQVLVHVHGLVKCTRKRRYFFKSSDESVPQICNLACSIGKQF